MIEKNEVMDEMTKTHCFQLLQWEYLLFFYAFYDRHLQLFGFWTVGWTRTSYSNMSTEPYH